MYDMLYRLYVVEGRLTLKGLNNAFLKGWITEEEKDLIISSKQL